MNGVGSRIFVDTNVLVYANVKESGLHSISLTELQKLYSTGNDLWLSRQVLREFIATLSRPQVFSNPQPISVILSRVLYFQQKFQITEDGPHVMQCLLDILASIPLGGKQVHDANIVATMQAYGIYRLLTHNTKDFERFNDLIEIISL